MMRNACMTAPLAPNLHLQSLGLAGRWVEIKLHGYSAAIEG
jgi:hypothetical protein